MWMRLFVFGALAALPVAAQSAETAPGAGSALAGWTVDLGAGAIYGPAFPGGKDTRVQPIPSLAVHDGDLFFASFNEGVGLNALRWQGLQAGPILKFAMPRNESDDRKALHGLGNVAFTPEAGVFLNYTIEPYASLKAELRHGIGGHDGFVADLSADVNAPPLLHNALFLSAGPRFAYYDKRYADAYYGISPSQSAASGYAAFEPGGGGKIGVGGAAVVRISDRITLVSFADYGRLTGAAANSPLVRGRYGARDQVVVGTTLSYRFGLSN